MTNAESIATRLSELPDFLAPLKVAASRYLHYPSMCATDGTVSIGHRPWVAELNYMFVLFPGVNSVALERYSRRFGVEVPSAYADFLRAVGGAFCFGMSLYGIPPSMLGVLPLLDRSVLQCHDLATGVRYWAAGYQLPTELFHFGGRHYSYRENIGYFIDQHGGLLAATKQGKVVGEWSNLTDLLMDELRVSEELEAKLHAPKS